jgi:hypothetical protein
MINRNKTDGLWAGKLKHSKDKLENIKWTNKPIKSFRKECFDCVICVICETSSESQKVYFNFN